MKKLLFLSFFLIPGFLFFLFNPREETFTQASPFSGGPWAVTILDSVDAGANAYPSYTSIAIDSNDNPHISYRGDPSNSLRYLTSQNNCWAAPEIVHDPGVSVARENSITIASDNTPHISFSYKDGNDEDLYYATKNSSGAWILAGYVFANMSLGMENDIALDSAGIPHFTHWQYNGGQLRHTTYLSSTWSSDDLGIATWDKTSLAIDSSDYIHLVYRTPSTNRLTYGTNLTGGWVWTDIDNCTGSTFGNSCGPSIALDSNDNVHISYSSGSDLKYASIISPTVTITTVVPGASPGKYHAIAIDSNNQPHISYHNSVLNTLWYATYTGGQWVTEVVDPETDTGRGNSIAVDSNGYVHISYRSESDVTLRYATNDPAGGCPTPTPTETSTPTNTPTSTETPTITPAPTATDTQISSSTPTPTHTQSPTPSETPSLTFTHTPSPTITPSPIPKTSYKVYLPIIRKP